MKGSGVDLVNELEQKERKIEEMNKRGRWRCEYWRK
jgi:hypothetical protein